MVIKKRLIKTTIKNNKKKAEKINLDGCSRKIPEKFGFFDA
jgi:hypothetical protein